MSDSLPSQVLGWTWQGGGSPAELRLRESQLAPLQPGQVLVRNHAIGLNPVDWKVLASQMNKVPGVDGAGEVVALGPEVDRRWLGARVAYHQSLKQPGSFASYTPLAAQVLMRLPDSLSYVAAAAFPCPALTAFQALEKIPARPGAPLLIAGAGGSVGHYLVQLAHARGFEVITASHARHWPRLQKLGASQCLADALMQWRQPYYAVIDAVSADQAARLSHALQANGHLVCIQDRVEQWPNPPFGRAISLHEVALGALHQHGDAAQWRSLTQHGERMLQAISQGTLHGESILTFPFEALPQQLLALQHRNFSGKQVIDVLNS